MCWVNREVSPGRQGIVCRKRMKTGFCGFALRAGHRLVASSRQITNLPSVHNSRGPAVGQNQTICFGEVHGFVEGLFDGDLHAKRVLSLANATLGVIETASLAVNTIGQGFALARGLVTKHAIKQVDRLLSNVGSISTPHFSTGFPTLWDSAPASMWPWTGQISTPMARPRSCSHC